MEPEEKNNENKRIWIEKQWKKKKVIRLKKKQREKRRIEEIEESYNDS